MCLLGRECDDDDDERPIPYQLKDLLKNVPHFVPLLCGVLAGDGFSNFLPGTIKLTPQSIRIKHIPVSVST